MTSLADVFSRYADCELQCFSSIVFQLHPSLPMRLKRARHGGQKEVYHTNFEDGPEKRSTDGLRSVQCVRVECGELWGVRFMFHCNVIVPWVLYSAIGKQKRAHHARGLAPRPHTTQLFGGCLLDRVDHSQVVSGCCSTLVISPCTRELLSVEQNHRSAGV